MSGNEDVCRFYGKAVFFAKFPGGEDGIKMASEHWCLCINGDSGLLEPKKSAERPAEGTLNAGDFVMEVLRAGIQADGDTIYRQFTK